MSDVWIDGPDWINYYDYENTEFATNNTFSLYFSADPLPAGVKGRGGQVVISSYGITAVVPVSQGNYTGLSSIKSEITTVAPNGDDFILKYPASAASVAVYNVAGQKVAEYKLPPTGQFTLPAGNLSKGVYLFNFSGANGKTTVKMIK